MAEPGNCDPIANRDAGYAVTRRIYGADSLVAGNKGRGWLDRPVAMRGMNVGVAQPGRFHPHRDLPWARIWDRPVLDGQRLPELVDDCGSHDCLLTRKWTARSA
jgi:hypothetical protein